MTYLALSIPQVLQLAWRITRVFQFRLFHQSPPHRPRLEVLCLTTGQEICWKERLRNNRFGVEWGAKSQPIESPNQSIDRSIAVITRQTKAKRRRPAGGGRRRRHATKLNQFGSCTVSRMQRFVHRPAIRAPLPANLLARGICSRFAPVALSEAIRMQLR